MPVDAEINPNVPDVLPDFVDAVPPTPAAAMPEKDGRTETRRPTEAVQTEAAKAAAKAAATIAPTVSVAPNVPVASAVPNTPKGQSAPNVSAAPNAPNALNVSNAPNVSNTSNTSTISSVPGIPNIPNVQNVPNVQKVQNIQNVSDIPDDAAGHREGECIPNTPDVAPEPVPERLVTPPPASPEATAEAAGETGTGAAAQGLALPSWLRRGYFFLIVTMVSLFGIFIFSQAIAALSQAAALPVWARYLLLVPLGVFLLLLLAVCVGLMHSWIRLRAVRQIDIAAMDELRERAETRLAGMERFREARASLEEYMRGFPLDGGKARLFSGLERGRRRSELLAEAREDLCARVTDSHAWLAEFRDRFQNVLDRTARERINSWSLKAAGCVMASPLPLLDAALILGICLKMIKDVATIYHVRCGGMSTLVLLNRTILTAFIAGATEYSMQRAGDVLGNELSGAMGDTALGAFGVGAVKLAVPRLGEGVVNAMFIRRLGKTVISLLQPLKP